MIFLFSVNIIARDAKFGSTFRIIITGKVCAKVELNLRIYVSNIYNSRSVLYVSREFRIEIKL